MARPLCIEYEHAFYHVKQQEEMKEDKVLKAEIDEIEEKLTCVKG